jgi:hypothetical protein
MTIGTYGCACEEFIATLHAPGHRTGLNLSHTPPQEPQFTPASPSWLRLACLTSDGTLAGTE